MTDWYANLFYGVMARFLKKVTIKIMINITNKKQLKCNFNIFFILLSHRRTIYSSTTLVSVCLCACFLACIICACVFLKLRVSQLHGEVCVEVLWCRHTLSKVGHCSMQTYSRWCQETTQRLNTHKLFSSRHTILK